MAKDDDNGYAIVIVILVILTIFIPVIAPITVPACIISYINHKK